MKKSYLWPLSLLLLVLCAIGTEKVFLGSKLHAFTHSLDLHGREEEIKKKSEDQMKKDAEERKRIQEGKDRKEREERLKREENARKDEKERQRHEKAKADIERMKEWKKK